MVVHHDLQTVPQYFDHLVMLNMRIVASGPTDEVFTRENLHKTYGGRLTLLDQAVQEARGGRSYPEPLHLQRRDHTAPGDSSWGARVLADPAS